MAYRRITKDGLIDRWNKARSYAIKQSHIYKAAEIRCERWVDDEDYDAPVTIWSETYENGKKQYRTTWRA